VYDGILIDEHIASAQRRLHELGVGVACDLLQIFRLRNPELAALGELRDSGVQMASHPKFCPGLLGAHINERDKAVVGAFERPILVESLVWCTGQACQDAFHRCCKLPFHATRLHPVDSWQ